MKFKIKATNRGMEIATFNMSAANLDRAIMKAKKIYSEPGTIFTEVKEEKPKVTPSASKQVETAIKPQDRAE